MIGSLMNDDSQAQLESRKTILARQENERYE